LKGLWISKKESFLPMLLKLSLIKIVNLNLNSLKNFLMVNQVLMNLKFNNYFVMEILKKFNNKI